MKYTLILAKSVQKQLDKLSQDVSARIFRRLANLESNPRPPDCKKLKGSEAWRIRVGDYRIIYEIHDRQLLLIVIDAGHRRDIYRSE
jgi:mRNA interferase RelE/StbE